MDGLQLLNGSTLTIGDIPVYALINGEMVELRSLFAPGEDVVRYTEGGSDGYVMLPEPATLALLLPLAAVALRRRRA